MWSCRIPVDKLASKSRFCFNPLVVKICFELNACRQVMPVLRSCYEAVKCLVFLVFTVPIQTTGEPEKCAKCMSCLAIGQSPCVNQLAAPWPILAAKRSHCNGFFQSRLCHLSLHLQYLAALELGFSFPVETEKKVLYVFIA